MTYDNLLTDLRRYLERGYVQDTEVYNQLPSLVNLGERDIATKMKILGTLEVLTDVMVAGTSIYDKPDRWRSTASWLFGEATGTEEDMGEMTSLFPRSYEYCRTYWPNASLREVPEFYADYDYYHYLVVPTPVANYPFELNVWQQPPLLDAGNQTNWLTDQAPQALLYSCLVQAEPFLKDGPWKAEWKDMYNDQLSALNTQDLQRVIDRSVVRRTV